MDLQEKLDFSVTLGAPVDGLLQKFHTIGPLVDAIFELVTKNPREKMLLLAMYCCLEAVANSQTNQNNAVRDFASTMPYVQKFLTDLIKDAEKESRRANPRLD